VITLLSSGVERKALVHVPAASAGQRLPLLIGLHGAGARIFPRYSGFSVLADSEGFIVVYPDPIDHEGGRTLWNISNRRAGGAPNDVQFISDLLAHVEGQVCVDTSRVYAAGVSNGGGMAALAACALSTRFAAIASIAGGYYQELPPCHPANPVSVVEVHGTADPIVPYDGSPPGAADAAGAIPPGGAVRPWVASWRRHDGCRGAPAVSRIAPRVERYEWGHCAGGAAVEHIEIFGGGHALPGALPPDRGQASTVSATWLVWSFLREHRQAAP
jgi:polyhydroxybutyrate depolymerase